MSSMRSSARGSARRMRRFWRGICGIGSRGSVEAKPVVEVDVDSPRKLRTHKSKMDPEEAERKRVAEVDAFVKKGIAKHVNNMHLQNTVMQLRKVCSHPFLFARGDDDKWSAIDVAATRVSRGGPAQREWEDALARPLAGRVVPTRAQGPAVQPIHDHARHPRGLGGRHEGLEDLPYRREHAAAEPPRPMDGFQNDGDAPDAPKLFLLSTRAGGLGVNLAAADTVIFYAQDWVQSADGHSGAGPGASHRANEADAYTPAGDGAYGGGEDYAAGGGEAEARGARYCQGQVQDADERGTCEQSLAEMAAELLRLSTQADEDDGVHAGDVVLSDRDMDALLDRSEEVFTGRGEGWRSGKGKSKGGQHAFEVFEPAVDEAAEGIGVGVGLEGIMGEEQNEVEEEEDDQP
uniref:Helicase C-terminal domain-containing protein n=1 Tax=Mycena chlorophos TaxID=658473 RepID=A0ABQ0LDW7_MYCCL|nr:predicted protein [Mycena chlorophos]